MEKISNATPSTPSAPEREPPSDERDAADAAARAYVGYLAAWFDIGQLVAGRQLERAGVREPLLNDA